MTSSASGLGRRHKSSHQCCCQHRCHKRCAWAKKCRPSSRQNSSRPGRGSKPKTIQPGPTRPRKQRRHIWRWHYCCALAVGAGQWASSV